MIFRVAAALYPCVIDVPPLLLLPPAAATATITLLLQVYSDFESFYADKRNAQAVYRPSPGAYFKEYHAITLVRSAATLLNATRSQLCLCILCSMLTTSTESVSVSVWHDHKTEHVLVTNPNHAWHVHTWHSFCCSQVGYDNEQQYWLAKNSYGSDWADKGVFKVGALCLQAVAPCSMHT